MKKKLRTLVFLILFGAIIWLCDAFKIPIWFFISLIPIIFLIETIIVGDITEKMTFYVFVMMLALSFTTFLVPVCWSLWKKCPLWKVPRRIVYWQLGVMAFFVIINLPLIIKTLKKCGRE